MYVSLGTDLVVSRAELPNAEATVKAIMRENAESEKRYKAAVKAYDKAVAARTKTLATVQREQAEYQAALKNYELSARGAGASNGVALATYQADLARWQDAYNREYAYGQAVSQQASEQRARSAAVFAKYGVSAPPGYTGCVTAADHAAYVDLCRQQSARVTVKGLGLISSSPGTPGCAYAELPVCASLGPRPPSAGAKPQAPSLIQVKKPVPPPARPVPAMPAPPAPPKRKPVPTITIKESGGVVSVTQGGFGSAGLLAAAALVVGGGAIYYFKRKKKVAPS